MRLCHAPIAPGLWQAPSRSAERIRPRCRALRTRLRNQLAKDLKETVRTYRAWVLVGACVVFGIVSPVMMKILPRIMPESEEFQIIFKDTTAVSAATQYFDNVAQIISLIVVILAAGVVAGKRSAGFYQILLTKPVRRGEIVASAFAAHALLILAGLIAGHVCFALYTELLFGGLSLWGVLASLAACAAARGLLIALTGVLGVAPTRAALAGVLSFLGFFLVSLLLGLLPLPWEIAPSALFGMSSEVVAGKAGLAGMVPGTITALLVAAALLFASMRLFERADL